MSSFWAIERNKKRYMETERLLACDFGRILYLPSYVVPVYWLTNTVTEERDRETVFDNDHRVGEGRGNLQRFLIMILLQEREGEICNACVLLVKRWRKLPEGSTRNWAHVVDAR